MDRVPPHKHNRVDSPPVDGKDLGPFLTLDFHPTTATWPSRNSAMVFSVSGGTRRVNFMINGAVYYEELTAA